MAEQREMNSREPLGDDTAAVQVSPADPDDTYHFVKPNFVFPDSSPPATRQFFNNANQPWWQFPDPIDNRLVRMTSFFVFAGALTLVIYSHNCDGTPDEELACKKHVWWMPILFLFDFVVRTAFGPTPFSPFGMMATAIMYALKVEPQLVPSSAKRFSFFLGIILNTVVTVLWWIVATKGTREFAGRPMIVLVVFAGLESIGGFCVGCWFFQTFFRMRDKWRNRNDYRKLFLAPTPAKKFFNPLKDGPDDDRTHPYEVDLVVIGAGSGGLACAKEAARLGKKVVLLDYVKPTTHGSVWGVGGTCVNVGCIPKKLFHQAGIVGSTLKHDAWYYGWGDKAAKRVLHEGYEHSWERCRRLIQRHIKSLNDGYVRGFEDAKVEYINALGTIQDPHTVKLCNGPCDTITTRRIVVAVGGKPKVDENVPGWDLCITSDDLFSLDKAPGKTLVVGASYIALECAGFLTELGMDATVMARSRVLRMFDQDMARRIVDNMEVLGTKFIEGCVPVKFEKTESGKIRCTYRNTTNAEELSEEYDTVLMAIGREPNTKFIGLEEAGVQLAPNGKVYHHNERTTVDNIYVIGDCGEPSIELTPVAIKQGLNLAQRLYNANEVYTELDFIPTTVFTPVEYGTIGVSEEKAIEVFGEDMVDSYHAEFTPLEHFLPHRQTTCYVKLIVNHRDKQRVVGFHYLGPNAGEVTQGFAAAFRAGMKKKDYDAIIGIHPTTAEEMVTLRRTKKSGLDPKKTGC